MFTDANLGVTLKEGKGKVESIQPVESLTAAGVTLVPANTENVETSKDNVYTLIITVHLADPTVELSAAKVAMSLSFDVSKAA